ncbi:MAG: hypothetical protein OXH85_06260 [Truepera sp.]|nr:hypothetical protein [Truepera sp.]
MSGHYARAGLAGSPEESGGSGEVEVPEVILAALWLLAVVAVVGAVAGESAEDGRRTPSAAA